MSDTNWPGVPVQSPSQLQAAQQPGANDRTLGPKGGSLTFTLPSADPDELGAVEALLKSYNESHRGFEFAVVRGAGLLHVVPRKARGLSGNLEPVKPVFDALITIEPRERTGEALLEEIFKNVSIATNTHVDIGKYVIPDEDVHRRIGKDGAVYFGAVDSGGRQRVVMAPIV